MPIIMILPLVAAALVAALGGLGGSLLSRQQSRADIANQNKYNSPAQQLSRLREAGLPFSAYSQGETGNQSALPETTGEGVKDAIATYATTVAQQKQNKILDEQLKLIGAQVGKTAAETELIGAQKNELEHETLSKDTDWTKWTPQTQRGRMKQLDQVYKEAELAVKRNENEMQKLDLQVKRDLTNDGTLSNTVRMQLHKLIAETRLDWNALELQKADMVLIHQLERGGITTAEAFIHAILSSKLSAKGLK